MDDHKEPYIVPPGQSITTHLSDAAEALLEGRMVEVEQLVYIPRTRCIGYEIQTTSGQWLASVRTQTADHSNVPGGGMVEITAEAKSKEGSPYSQNEVMQGLILLLQYMTHKAYIRQDERYGAAAETQKLEQ